MIPIHQNKIRQRISKGFKDDQVPYITDSTNFIPVVVRFHDSKLTFREQKHSKRTMSIQVGDQFW